MEQGNERKPIEKLRLSDAFMTEDSSNEFEWTATMINLNEGKNEGLLEEGRELGLKTACIQLFQKGVSYALVRASITQLTNEELQAIYKDVTGKKLKNDKSYPLPQSPKLWE